MIKYLSIIYFLFSSILFSDTTIVALNQVHHSFGGLGNNRTTTSEIQFPNGSTDYSSITMRVNLECPTGGCDPWDRKAKISVYHIDQWIEIGRYVTPYGVECGWEIDVTDYRSILRGEVILKSFIDTWVQPGWLVSVEFDFVEGQGQYPFTVVRNLWNYDRLVYGDPTIPVDISTIQEYLPNDTEEAYIRITTTGHGQGNTENAAEFSDKRHDILINGEVSHVHNFWRPDCEFNDCSPQNGTWQYDRAGFCPGDKVDAQNLSILDFSLPGNTVEFDYVLEDYFNQCSPNNPSCVNGVTCTSCAYNNTGHTEPFYYIGSQLIIHTTNKHSNADVYLSISDQDTSMSSVDIYLENYVSVYGVSFKLDLSQLEIQGDGNLSFEDGISGRAEESNWTVSINGEGLIVALAQGSGEPIQPGEGILTRIQLNLENISILSGSLKIIDVEASGYFGRQLSFETGEPTTFELLNTNEELIIPTKIMLHNAYPNPFNPYTTISYDMSEDNFVNLTIFDLAGKKIKTLLNESMVAGFRSVRWRGLDEQYQPVSTGVYLCVFQAGNFRETKKIILLK